MDRSSLVPRVLHAASLEIPGVGGGRERRTPHRRGVVSPFAEKICAKPRAPGAFGICLLSGAEGASWAGPELGPPASLGNLLCAVLNGALDPPCSWPVDFFFPSVSLSLF